MHNLLAQSDKLPSDAHCCEECCQVLPNGNRQREVT
jgi:hypothetical protein